MPEWLWMPEWLLIGLAGWLWLNAVLLALGLLVGLDPGKLDPL
jgi:hypothetical protein